ncbi:MAG: helix-turn-helix domain-containing protein [Oscillibacter sp.]|nr:helix-turn-helix domain-containing protein [Oscillibacter sp.]
MDRYVTGDVIRKLRKRKKMTQEELAGKLFVSCKAVSKWETGNGFPDISLLEPLSRALDISVIELLSGDLILNRNKSAHMAKSRLYVCPVCGNVIQCAGEAAVSCCGITLPPLEPEPPDKDHEIRVERVEDEFFVSVRHPMTKEHYISFLSAVSDQRVQFVKLYPEGGAEARFQMDGVTRLYAYCNRHGLFQWKG